MNYDSFRAHVAKKIRQLRLSKGLTQEDMEEGKFGIHVRTYQRIENLETDITLNNLYLISKRLSVDIRDFFDPE